MLTTKRGNEWQHFLLMAKPASWSTPRILKKSWAAHSPSDALLPLQDLQCSVSSNELRITSYKRAHHKTRPYFLTKITTYHVVDLEMSWVYPIHELWYQKCEPGVKSIVHISPCSSIFYFLMVKKKKLTVFTKIWPRNKKMKVSYLLPHRTCWCINAPHFPWYFWGNTWPFLFGKLAWSPGLQVFIIFPLCYIVECTSFFSYSYLCIECR